MTSWVRISDEINQRQEDYMKEKSFGGRWKSLRPSGIGDVCQRRIFYYMTCGELAQEQDTALTRIFQEGCDQEIVVRRYLSEIGFELNKIQMEGSWPEYKIFGKVDGCLEYDGKKYLAEIKTVSQYGWESLKTLDDIKDSKFYYKWYAQLQLYLLLFEYSEGIFIIKRKEAKELRIIEVSLDYDFAESLLQKAKAINDAISTNTPPSFINKPLECKKCPFYGRVCNPTMNYDGQILNIEEEEIARLLNRRDVLSEPRREYEAIDKELKENFVEWLTKDENINEAICGDYHISVKKQLRKMKAQEERIVESYVTKIEKMNPTGDNEEVIKNEQPIPGV